MKSCPWCSLSDEEKKWLVFESAHWSVYLADLQDYTGRCILVSQRHCDSLSALNADEWLDLKHIVDKLEHCYRDQLGAALCNWSCLMNSFYKEEHPEPHLHIHARPRYKNALVINDHRYEDTEYGHHYALNRDTQVYHEDRIALWNMIKSYLNTDDTIDHTQKTSV